MSRGFYVQIAQALLQAGCVVRRQGKGDHEIWFSPITGKTFPVDKGTKSRHLANGVMKQAGLRKTF